MKTVRIALCTLIGLSLFSCPWGPTGGSGSRIADHTVVKALWEGQIPETAILAARTALKIGYGHTSHGSQIADGMGAMVAFANAGNLGGTAYAQDLFAYSQEGAADTLHLFQGDGYGEGWLDHDAGYGGEHILNETRLFLDDPVHADFNTIMWSWCGQLSWYSEQGLIDEYLTPMATLQDEYPDVTFIYMTGHLDGTGVEGNLHQRNEQIRAYCRANNKWLFDFADIESYDPDGNYYLADLGNDGCNWDADGDGDIETVPDSGDPAQPTGGDANWATAWQDAHTVNVDWYDCGAAHSHPLNANMKAYAAWWLFARLGGWSSPALD